MPGKSEASLLLDSLFHVDSVIVMIAIVVVSWLPCEDVFFVDPGLPQPFFHAPWRREDSGNQMLSRTVCSMFSFFTIKNHQTFINFGVATVFEQPFWDDYDWSTKIPCGAVSLDRSHVGAVPGCAVPPENLNAFLRAEMQTCLGRCILDQAAINSMMTYISYILIWKKTLERGQKTPRYQEMSKTYIVFFWTNPVEALDFTGFLCGAGTMSGINPCNVNVWPNVWPGRMWFAWTSQRTT